MSDSLTTDSNAEPAAKRARTNSEGMARNNEIPMDMDTGIKLDSLHLSHLRHILDFLSTEDIMNSLTMSKQWKDNVLEYLRGSRFCFEYYYLPRTHYVPRLLGLVDDVRHRRAMPFDMTHGDSRGFQAKIEELGPAIVSIVLDYLDETCCKIITQNCPNLQDMMLVGLQARPPGQHLAFKQCELPLFTEEGRQCLQQLQLKRFSIVHSPNVTEDYIKEFLKTDSIEEIVICRNRSVEGRCLTGLKSNLECLRLNACSLNFNYLNSIADRLTALTMLDLSNNPSEILLNVHRLLAKTDNLEYLFLDSYEKTNVGNEFVESLRRLGRLKHLSLCWNDNVNDAWLKALALGCQNLETVDIENKYSGWRENRRMVTVEAVLALCLGAPKLVHLGVAGHDAMIDTQLAACVTVCPDLESLDLRGCRSPSRLQPVALPELAGAVRGAARRRAGLAAAKAAGRSPRPHKPLRLRLARTAIDRNQSYPTITKGPSPSDLIYDFVDAPRIFRLV